jgi:hypothetical protein
MGGKAKLSLVLVAAILLAAGVAACGDDGDSTSATGEAAAVGKAAPPGEGADSQKSGSTGRSGSGKGADGSGKAADGSGKAADGSGAGGTGGAGGDSGEGEGGKGSGEAGGSGGSSGGGSSGSGSGPGRSKEFLTPGGDNSVQKFGTEASGAQLAAASAAVEGFMAARADHDWPAACKYLAAGTVAQVEKIIAPGEGCAATLTKVSKNLPENGLPNTMSGPIDSFRVEGSKGFALWHGNDGVDYVLPLTMEGGWKLTLFEPTALGSPKPS